MRVRIVSSEQVYEGRAVSLRRELVELPSGKRFYREIVVHSGASAVIPITPSGKIVFVKQYRRPIGEYILEIPAGTLRPGEDPEACARRELEEETGYAADELIHLITIYPCPGYSSERLHIYLARGLRRGAQSLEIDEDLSVVELGLEEALDAIRRSEIRDAKTITAILYYYNFVTKC
ncbi:MAG: NUDIX hydrolase [Nitrososphaerota archaeon]